MEATNDSHFLAHRLRLVLPLLLAAVFFSATGCGILEKKIIYDVQRFPKQWSEPTACELAGLTLENACFESCDGTKLHGWFVQPANGEYKNVILFAHGRSGNVGSHKEKLLAFAGRNQAAVFIFDYRGYGKSGGRPSEKGLYQDVTAARNWLACRTGLSPSEIVLFGRSLGAAAVIDLAARDGSKALIIESTFTTAPEVLQHHTRGILTGKRMISCFNSIGKIGAYPGPVFISHSRQDKALPFSQGVRLANAATGSSRVVFYELEGGHKADPGEDYHQALCQFLNSLSSPVSCSFSD